MTKHATELNETELEKANGGGVIFSPAGSYSPDDPIFYVKKPTVPQRDGYPLGGEEERF